MQCCSCMGHVANFCFCHELGRFFSLLVPVSKGIKTPCMKQAEVEERMRKDSSLAHVGLGSD